MKLANKLPKVLERDVSFQSKGSNVFSPAQILKYKKWFACLTKNRDEVSIETIANVFVSAGILKFKRELAIMFENSGITNDSIGFDDFLDVLAVNYVSTKLCIEKLDSMIDDAAGGLSSDTILTHERRKLLLEHVVDRPAVRAWSIDHSFSVINAHKLRRRERKDLFRVEEAHVRERLEATEVVWELRNALLDTKRNEEDEKERTMLANAMAPRPLTAHDVLRPLEELFETSVAEAAKATVQNIEELRQDCMHTPVKKDHSSQAVRFFHSEFIGSRGSPVSRDYDPLVLSPLITPRPLQSPRMAGLDDCDDRNRRARPSTAGGAALSATVVLRPMGAYLGADSCISDTMDLNGLTGAPRSRPNTSHRCRISTEHRPSGTGSDASPIVYEPRSRSSSILGRTYTTPNVFGLTNCSRSRSPPSLAQMLTTEQPVKESVHINGHGRPRSSGLQVEGEEVHRWRKSGLIASRGRSVSRGGRGGLSFCSNRHVFGSREREEEGLPHMSREVLYTDLRHVPARRKSVLASTGNCRRKSAGVKIAFT